ncbi:MAG: hypothetical protein D6722_20340, partial [Bacteroidetes bacterium]
MSRVSFCFRGHPHGLAHLLFLFFLAGLLGTPIRSQAQSSDVILQGFYWNSHPGDVSDDQNGGLWWDTLATVAPEAARAGIGTVWVPPPTKGYGGRWDMGYGIKDFYDLGEYNQNGSIRTRHGNRTQLENAITALHNQNLQIMVDIVLNHRGGADGQADYEWGGPYNPTPWTLFNPQSGRFPGIPSHYHPNNAHNINAPNYNFDYQNPLFFEDHCYFNNADQTPPPGGWYFGAPPFGLGPVGDSLISWGRWLMNDMGFDQMRLDAVKHIDHAFLAKFLTEVRNGNQPFAVGESFDYGLGSLASYHGAVTGSPNSGSKAAQMSLFDFPLRGALKAILNDGSGNADLDNQLNNSLVWGSALTGFDVVTWVENHDTDRAGFIGGVGSPPCQAGEIQVGNSCLQWDNGSGHSDHDPIFQDKEDMGYPFIMAAEGRPTVFWKDFFHFGMADDITWQIAMRQATATGGSNHLSALNPVYPGDAQYQGQNHGGNMFVMRRNGLSNGTQDGLLLGLNDHPSLSLGVWVDAPFSNKYLKDYSDGYLFVTQRSYNNSRTFVPAQPRDYSWWSLTGLYPTPPGETPAQFSMDAQPGGSVHFLALDAGDAANFLVNGSPIEAGDQIAVLNAADEVCGIGRIGQGFGWDGSHDMLIEVIGPFPTDADPTGGPANGLAVGESFRVLVYDASTGQTFEASGLSWASNGSNFTFNPLRPDTPNRNGTVSSFGMTTTATGTFGANGVSQLTAFSASTPFPVNQLDFRGEVLDGQIALSWTTAREENNRGFGVEMRREGGAQAFEEAGFVTGAGTTDQPQSYQFRLPEPAAGTYIFRLRQEDFDGQIAYSPTLRLQVAAAGLGLALAPNPVRNRLSLRSTQAGDLPLSLR